VSSDEVELARARFRRGFGGGRIDPWGGEVPPGGGRDPDRDLALQRELVACFALPAIRPEQSASGNLDELRADPYASVQAAERSVQDPVDAKRPPHAIGASVANAIARDRSRCDDAHALSKEAPETDDHLVREPFTKRL